eukprot:5042364-Prorocentrum_lima.AAC.1
MTSSLVGSEMCIRDSLSAVGCRLRAWPPMRTTPRGDDLVDRVHQGPRSVSYTHLTLPTICSV